jgi:rhodanese-related sulfurtransferase
MTLPPIGESSRLAHFAIKGKKRRGSRKDSTLDSCCAAVIIGGESTCSSPCSSTLVPEPMLARQRLLLACLLAPLTLLLSGFFFGSPTWEDIDKLIGKKYPTVAHIEVEELHAALERGETPLLIDARAPEEYAVSHLPGAHNLTTVGEVRADKETAIVVYCSVGVRSAILAKALQEAGFSHVRNLRGSIFAWAEKGYPLWRGDTSADKVHPYDKKWGTLLNSDLHQYHPPAATQ